MHSDFARQGVRIMQADRDNGVMRILAEATDDICAEQILAALQQTEALQLHPDGALSSVIHQALGDLSFETRRYIESSESSVRQEQAHLKECPDCRHSVARLQTQQELLEALFDRRDAVDSALALFPLTTPLPRDD